MSTPDFSFDEAGLLHAFRRNEPGAFVYLLQLYQDRLVRFTCRYTGDRPQAEDIVLDSFRKLFAKNGDFNTLSDIRSFLFVSSRNAAVDHQRYLKRTERVLADYALHYSRLATGEHLLDDPTLLCIIQTTLEQCSQRSQEVFHLYFEVQLSQAAIGRELHMHRNTVRGDLHLVVTCLRQALTLHGYFDGP